jgi:hypothetical protein
MDGSQNYFCDEKTKRLKVFAAAAFFFIIVTEYKQS